jgi:hypothetical protein|tara:strand:+ start:96 stop:815 length:720 start_codon:yes stop_codon:yes gene_type:complete
MADESTDTNDTQTAPSTTESKSIEPAKVFTQDEVDAVVKKRLEKRNREVERKFDGVDPEEYRAMKAAQDAEEMERQKERGDFENVMKQTVEKWEVKTNALQDELRRVKVDGALLSAANRGKAINAEQVANLLHSSVRMTEDGSVEVIDNNGAARYDDHGTPLTPDALVDEFLLANPHFVAATPAGTGSQSSVGGGFSSDNISSMAHDQFVELMKTKAGRDRYAEFRKTQADGKGYINRS